MTKTPRRGRHARQSRPTRPLLTLLLAVVAWTVAGTPPSLAKEEPDVVDHVDLERYAGKWYEIASIPNMFQRGCTRTIARYELRDDGKLEVINSCRKGGLDEEPSSTSGTARVVDEETNAKLRVSFFWPLSIPYWIIALDDEYQWAVVGTPSRNHLWIISRSPTMDEELYRRIVQRAAEQGYDVSELERTLHPEQLEEESSSSGKRAGLEWEGALNGT
jgi:apolipoprotein D and lipocalin family protein